LRDAGEFQAVFRQGARVERGSFVLLWIPADGARAVGFAASRRLGGSVERNRARRRLREAYRRQKGLMPAAGVRLCFVARPKIMGVPFSELAAEVAEALRSTARRLIS